MGKWLHRITNVNVENRVGDCANCGPVRIKKTSKGWRCYYGAKYGRLVVKPKSDRCDICKRKVTVLLDHCHETNLFRGWLCKRCNTMIGAFEHDKELLAAALKYLGW